MGERDPKTFGYGRASTRKQDASPETQRLQIRDYCRHYGLPGDPTTFLDPATSGKVPWEDRPAGSQLFKFLRPGDHVVISKLDRAFRSLKDCCIVLDRFAKQGIKVHIVNLMGGAVDLSSPMGRFMLHVLAAFAELERAFISERTRDGLRARRKQGKKYCHFAGYGFRWEKHREGNRVVKVKVRDDDERNIMAHIAAWRNQDAPLEWAEIVEHLKKIGSKTSEGKEWSIMRVRRAYRRENILRLQENSEKGPWHKEQAE